MSAEASTVLRSVAQSFLDQDKPLQAIRCLEALCLANQSAYPEQEAGIHFEASSLFCRMSFRTKESRNPKTSYILALIVPWFCCKMI